MQVIIGKLGNQPFPITEASVSKYHAELVVNDINGQMIIHDTNSTNGTYILDKGRFVRIKQARVGLDTIIRLGASVKFKVSDLLKPVAKDPGKTEDKPVDISMLSTVYKNYTQNKMDIETSMGNIMMLRIGAMSLGGILSGLLFTCLPKDLVGDETTTTVMKSVFSIVVLALSWILVSAKNNALIKRKYNNEEYYKKKYRCPKCGYSFGTKIYDNLIAEGKCPNPSCRCKFTEK